MPLMPRTKFTASAATCCANSRVGQSTSTLGCARPGTGELFGLLSINWLIKGNKNAAVFPLPVWLLTNRSPPAIAAGITRACTGVPWVKPNSAMFFSSGAARAKFWNSDPVCFVSLEIVMLLLIPDQGMSPYVAPMVLLGAMVKDIDHQTSGSAFFMKLF